MTDEITKVCSQCKSDFPLSRFYRSRSGLKAAPVEKAPRCVFPDCDQSEEPHSKCKVGLAYPMCVCGLRRDDVNCHDFKTAAPVETLADDEAANEFCWRAICGMPRDRHTVFAVLEAADAYRAGKRR